MADTRDLPMNIVTSRWDVADGHTLEGYKASGSYRGYAGLEAALTIEDLRTIAKRRTPKVNSDEPRRATPAEFVQEAVAELRKVVWPTGSQLQQYFLVVLIFVLIMIGIVTALDLLFGAGILAIFG